MFKVPHSVVTLSFIWTYRNVVELHLTLDHRQGFQLRCQKVTKVSSITDVILLAFMPT